MTEPDVLVRRQGQGFTVELNPATLPRVLVNRRYHAELKAGATDKKSRAWLSEQLQSASWLVRALDQRARTIVKIVSEVVACQEGFFREGVKGLRPLTMTKVAEAVSMHESTVSRVASGKTLMCEHGLFELRFFFSSGVAADDGEGASAEAVKAAIGKLVTAETEVLSDDALVDLLKEQGFVLARRTVAKYREAIGIGSSVQRRRQRAIQGKAA
jgi:RNA polymerase sigma-54 factor